MNAREKTLLSAALVLGLVGAYAYWGLNRPTQVSNGVTTKPGGDSYGEVPRIAKLRLVDESEYSGDIFGHRTPPIIPQPAPDPGDNGGLIPIPVPEKEEPRRPTQLVPPPLPPQRPVIDSIIDVPLSYSGFARDDSGELVAFIETNGQGNVPAGHYNLKDGDYFIGRYRVAKITADAVEFEDMDRAESAAKRTQSVSRKK